MNKNSNNNRKDQSKIQNPKSKIEIGCQGWNYPDWVSKAGGESIFYPRGTRSNEMLEIYAQVFDTIEVDSTFYAIPPSSSLENWFNKTPEISCGIFSAKVKSAGVLLNQFSKLELGGMA